MEAGADFLLGSNSSIQICHKQTDDRKKRVDSEVVFGAKDGCGVPTVVRHFCRMPLSSFLEVCSATQGRSRVAKHVEIIPLLLNMIC